MLTSVSDLLDQAKKADNIILFESAQGTMLGIDLGTYPYVTSSNTTSGAVATGSGVGPMIIDDVLGVTSAYRARVESVQFPTEYYDAAGSVIAVRGREFGSTTGRPRRCGWFDVLLMRHATRVNSLSSMALTKLDVLNDFAEIKICTGYRYKDAQIDSMPFDSEVLSCCEPIYETVPGWQTKTLDITEFSQPPKAAQNCINRLKELCCVRFSIISTGPERNQKIIVN